MQYLIIIILFIFSILVFDRQRGQSNIEHLESDNSDNSHESEPFLQPSKKFSTLNNYPNSKGNITHIIHIIIYIINNTKILI